MYDKIINTMKKSLNYTSLDIFRLSDGMRDFIKLISLGKLTDGELEGCKYFTKTIKSDVSLSYIFVDTPTKENLKYDIADRNGNTHIVIYRYNDTPDNDDIIIRTLLSEATAIIHGVYGIVYTSVANMGLKQIFIESKFETFSSRQKLMILAPFMIVCKIFENMNIGMHNGGNLILQKSLNRHNIEQIDTVIKFILKERPDVDTLFNLNGFLFPFRPVDMQ